MSGLVAIEPFEVRIPQSCKSCPHMDVNTHSDECYCMREDGRPIHLRRGQRRPQWCQMILIEKEVKDARNGQL